MIPTGKSSPGSASRMYQPTPTAADSEEEVALRSKLLAWGQAHGWPQLPFRAWAAIAEGEPYWKLAAVNLGQEDLEEALARGQASE